MQFLSHVWISMEFDRIIEAIPSKIVAIIRSKLLNEKNLYYYRVP